MARIRLAGVDGLFVFGILSVRFGRQGEFDQATNCF